MAFFKTIYSNGAYFIPLRNLDTEDLTIAMRFDTGAVNTVVSLEAITRNVIDKERFVREIKQKAEPRIFRSASGDEMEGYLVYAENVMLSKAQIKKLYYYLIVNADDSVSLLGDDFISKCRFRHEVDGSIEVEYFDAVNYNTSVQNAVSGKEIEKLMQLCSLQ